jgi:Rrf2 family transcriptional regulator, iron-sulfur cluster assembly transcription factor
MLSQASAYAISTLGYISGRKGQPTLIKEAARACNAPPAYLAKIINQLAHEKLVQTRRGARGGVLLARPAREVSLYEVCAALDDDILKPRCMLGHVPCAGDRACPAHQVCRKWQLQAIRFLKRTTVADIARFEATLRDAERVKPLQSRKAI